MTPKGERAVPEPESSEKLPGGRHAPSPARIRATPRPRSLCLATPLRAKLGRKPRPPRSAHAPRNPDRAPPLPREAPTLKLPTHPQTRRLQVHATTMASKSFFFPSYLRLQESPTLYVKEVPNLSPSGEPHRSGPAPERAPEPQPDLNSRRFLQPPERFNLHPQEMTSQEFSAPPSHVIRATDRVPFTQTDRQRPGVWPLARAQSRSHASENSAATGRQVHRPRLSSLLIGSQGKPRALLYKRPRPSMSAICQDPLGPTFRGLPLAPHRRPLFRAAFRAFRLGGRGRSRGGCPKSTFWGLFPNKSRPSS